MSSPPMASPGSTRKRRQTHFAGGAEALRLATGEDGKSKKYTDDGSVVRKRTHIENIVLDREKEAQEITER